MAHAIALAQRESLTTNETGYEVTYAVTFAGADVPEGTGTSGATVTFDYGDDNATLRSKVRRAVETSAAEANVSVETVQADVLITV